MKYTVELLNEDGTVKRSVRFATKAEAAAVVMMTVHHRHDAHEVRAMTTADRVVFFSRGAVCVGAWPAVALEAE